MYNNDLDKKMKYFNSFLKENANFNNESNTKFKKTSFKHSLNFYNSLSLLMLVLIGGGLVGIIFILCYTFRFEDKTNFQN